MSDPHLDSIEDLLNNDDVPPRVTNRALFRGQQAIWSKLGDNTNSLADLAEWRVDMDQRVDHLEEQQSVNPSLFAFVKADPIKAAKYFISFTVIFLVFLTVALSLSDPLKSWVAALLP